MSYINQNISTRLTFSAEVIAIVQVDPELSEQLATTGFIAEKITLGSNLEQAARAARVVQQSEFVSRLEASQAVAELDKRVRSFLVADRKMVQAALRTVPGRYEQLRMNSRLSKRRSVFLQQARNIYLEIQAHQDLIDVLSTAGVTPVVIDSRLQFVDSLAAAMEYQQRQTAEAEIATQKLRIAMSELDEWMADFLGAARYVFRKDPKQLKKLGLPIR